MKSLESFLLGLFWFSCFFLVVRAEKAKFYNGIKIVEANQLIDVRSHTEEVHTTYKFQNTGSQTANSVFVAFTESQARNLAYIQGFVVNNKKSTSPLQTHRVELDVPGRPSGAIFYQIDLPSPLKPQDTASIQTLASFTHVLVPSPRQITQADPQLVRLAENGRVFSPYVSESQVINVKLGSSRVESYTKKGSNLKNDDLVHGPFQNVPAFATQDLAVHYENNSPFVTFRTLVKEIEVSHWGNVAVEETYLLEHTGATLSGSFSRYDYQRVPSKPSFRQIVAILPASASDIYYRDHIGNISTSHVRHEEDKTVFEVAPRFPMFGGWKADFYIGYNLPASEFLFVDRDTGKYVLNISFGTPFPGGVVDDLELRVVLPEGSGDIEWTTSFDVDSEDKSTKVTYLDTFGRPVLILRKKNVVRHHAQPLLVSYSFSTLSMLREPLMLTAAFALFFVVSTLASRLTDSGAGWSSAKPVHKKL